MNRITLNAIRIAVGVFLFISISTIKSDVTVASDWIPASACEATILCGYYCDYEGVARSTPCPIYRFDRLPKELKGVVINFDKDMDLDVTAEVCGRLYSTSGYGGRDVTCTKAKGISHPSQIYFNTQDLKKIRALDWRHYLFINIKGGYSYTPWGIRIAGYRLEWE
jgi:hypothetical protein